MAKRTDIILPEIAGLRCLAAQKREQAGWVKQPGTAPEGDARVAYEKGVQAAELLKEADAAEAQARENATMVLGIETIIRGMNQSDFKSAARTRAVRKLEEASMILRREIGD